MMLVCSDSSLPCHVTYFIAESDSTRKGSRCLTCAGFEDPILDLRFHSCFSFPCKDNVINPAGLNYNLVPIFSFVMLGPSFF